jgi:hypothetical protein
MERGDDIVRTCTSSPLNTSQRGYADTEEVSATPLGSGYGDTSSFGSLKAETGSYGQLA